MSTEPSVKPNAEMIEVNGEQHKAFEKLATRYMSALWSGVVTLKAIPNEELIQIAAEVRISASYQGLIERIKAEIHRRIDTGDGL